MDDPLISMIGSDLIQGEVPPHPYPPPPEAVSQLGKGQQLYEQ
jgi:hypothetical protein